MCRAFDPAYPPHCGIPAMTCLPDPQREPSVVTPPSPLRCELCQNAALVFCQADEAFLCSSCDMDVHTANFLVSRHVRAVLCQMCGSDTFIRVCGARPALVQAHCRNCSTSSSLGLPAYGGMKALPTAGEPSNLEGISFLRGTVEAPGPKCWVPETVVRVPQEVGELGEVGETKGCRAEDLDSPVSVLSIDRLKRKRNFEGLEETSLPSSPCTPTPSQQEGKRLRQCSDDTLSSSSDFEESELEDGSSIASEESAVGPLGTPTIHARLRQSTGRDFLSEKGMEVDGLQPHGHLSQQTTLGEQASARLERVLSRWHKELGLSSHTTCGLAFHLFKRALKVLQPCRMAADALRVTLATCLWAAAKVDEAQAFAPKASEVAEATDVSVKTLVAMEVELLNLLDWRMLEGWLQPAELSD